MARVRQFLVTFISDQILYTKFYIIIFLTLTSIGIIGLLFALSRHDQKEHFIRLFPPHVLLDKREFQLPYNSYYISGYTDSGVYLSNTTAPAACLFLNYSLTSVTNMPLKFPDGLQKISTAFITTIDSPNISMLQGFEPTCITGQLSSRTMQLAKLPCPKFDAAIPVSNHIIFIRTYDSTAGQNVIKKITDKGEKPGSPSFYPDKQQDGIFSLDGKLILEKRLRKVVYVYFYQNQFACLDSNMTLLYQARTIDTNRMAKITLSSYSNGIKTTTTFATPPKQVNGEACADGQLLFINLHIISERENLSIYTNNKVIDVYNMVDGSYRYSFYLPAVNGEKLMGLSVRHNHLVALFEKHIASYRLNL